MTPLVRFRPQALLMHPKTSSSTHAFSQRGRVNGIRARKPRDFAMRCLCLIGLIFAAVNPVTAFAQAAPIGIFLAPPVPIELVPFTITIDSVAYGPPVSVAKTTFSVNGNVIDLTVYLDHGSAFFTPEPFEAVQEGPPLPAGAYTFRYFTADKYPGDTTYGPIGDPLGTTTAYVTTAQNVTQAIEYYNAPRDHYFMTAYESEIVLLDAGHFSGWVRTGQQFQVYSTDPSTNGLASGLSPVCRYYGLPSFGLDTHFFSASEAECAAVAVKWPAQWVLETPNAFYAYLPDTQDGSCPAGTIPVYRLYNQRADVNHRYTTSLEIRQQMVAQGWIPEGYGEMAVGICALQ